MTAPSAFLRSACFINGAWVTPASPSRIDVFNPATGELLGSVPDLGKEECELALNAAETAFQEWRLVTGLERGHKLRSIGSFLRKHHSDLAKLLTLEQGKPISEAEGEIEYAANYFDWFSEEARRAYGEVIPAPSTHSRVMVTREPVGICAAITPWNFPIAMLARKVAPALAAGCSFIGKPASETPFSALVLGLAAESAGLPPGVLNIITGAPEPIAATLLDSPIVRKISFTGSTEVGRILMARSAQTLKRLTLELGGNAPFIVFSDADLANAVEAATHAKFRNAGQTCVAANRFLIEESIAEEFSLRLIEAARKLHVGNGMDPETDIGPLISASARLRVINLVNDALAQGATLALGGAPPENSPYLWPTILTNVSREMSIWRQEIFGPVVTIHTFQSEDEAITLANDTGFGLVSYLFTKDISRTYRVGEALQSGMLAVNSGTVSLVEAPFGGIKASGYGREGGHMGLEEYLSPKFWHLKINESTSLGG